MIEPSSFFVYGTLKQNQLRGGMWPRRPLRVTSGMVRARLFDLGPYPAALSGDSWLLGEIWQFQHADVLATLRVLDEIEGYQPRSSNNEYIREMVDAHDILGPHQESTVSCWMYFSPSPDHLVGKREILPFCQISELFSQVRQEIAVEKVAFWPDPSARVPRSFSEE